MALRKVFLLGAYMTFLFLPLCSPAAAPATWKIIPAKSSITFTATQNNAPVTGKFNSFNGEIKFDPTQLNASHVQIVIDTNSISTSYKALQDTLYTAEWFDTKAYPQAVFTANKFSKTGSNIYQAQGTLTIRNKSLPVNLTFTLDQYTDTSALVKGSAVIKRTQYGVGSGQWANTNEIKDDVKIDFVLAAER